MSSRILHRFTRHTDKAHDQRAVDRAVSQATTINTGPAGTRIGYRSPEGDPQRLRGIPAIGKSVGGAIPGTSPHWVIEGTNDART